MLKVENITVSQVEELKGSLLEVLESEASPTVDLSSCENIDVAGLQLLLSLTKEGFILGKEVIYKGGFKTSFRTSLNRILYTSEDLADGEELTDYLHEVVRGN